MSNSRKFEKYLLERTDLTGDQVNQLTQLIAGYITQTLKTKDVCVLTNLLTVKYVASKGGVSVKLNRNLISKVCAQKKLSAWKFPEKEVRQSKKLRNLVN